MKKFKLNILLLIIFICSFSLLMGCSNKNDLSKKATDDKKSAENVTLTYYVPGYDDPTFKEAYDQRITAFEKEYPEIKIKVIASGWDQSFQKMMSMIQAKEAPDVMVTGSRRLNQLDSIGAIEQLDSYIKPEKKSEYIDSVYKTGSVNGKQFGLPIAFSSRALYYRKDLIKVAPKNWDELVEISKKVEKENPGIKGFGIPAAADDATVTQLFNYLYQNGAKAFDETGKPVINSLEAIQALQFYTDLYRKHKVVPNPVELKRGDLSGLFKNGKIAMFVSGPWEKNVMQLEPNNSKTPYGVALLPQGKNLGEILVTDSVTISSQSKHKEEAWKFIEFTTKYEYQNKYDEIIGFFPILKKELKESRYTTDFLKPFTEMIQYGKPEPTPKVWEEFQDIIVKAIQKSMLGETTPEKALNEAQKLLEESIK